MDTELQQAGELIVQCLIHYGRLSENEARIRLNESGILVVNDELDRAMLFHEPAYYWAMSILQERSDWYLDPELWPPPADYDEWLFTCAGHNS